MRFHNLWKKKNCTNVPTHDLLYWGSVLLMNWGFIDQNWRRLLFMYFLSMLGGVSLLRGGMMVWENFIFLWLPELLITLDEFLTVQEINQKLG